MSYNLGNLSKEKKDKINLDLAASGIVYQEKHEVEKKYNAYDIERTLSDEMKAYFRERLEYYRNK